MLLPLFSVALLLPGHLLSISSLDLSHIRQGWGTPQRDRSVTGTPLRIAGQHFDNGLGTHANSTFRIRLDGKASRFHAVCGVDDNARNGAASIVFSVLGDGKTLWTSAKRTWKDPAVTVDVPLKGVTKLSLVADDAGDGNSFDHADWCDAKITYAGQPPAAIVPPVERPIILTPPAHHAPRINGPSVQGVRPGSPFLYLVPVTGDRPMQITASGLPSGLKLNVATGVIRGHVARRGSYRVSLTAANRLGTTRRTLTIIVGDEIALTPHMGWNSWYVWLAQHGWQYVNIDDCWARIPGSKDPIVGGETRDASGVIQPNAKFPDMLALTDYIHSKGLKAGIYTSPGPTTCAGYEGAFRHEAIDARTFAEWEFDFLKYDWCSYTAELPGLAGFKKPYSVMGELLKQQKRDMVFNLCQYGMGKVWKWGKEVGGHSWRTAGDLGIGFTMFEDAFGLYSKEHLDRYAGSGAFNDPDYLLLGNVAGPNGTLKPTSFTPNEQYTQVSMWSLISAPLILSGDISTLDPFTLSLLTNDEVLAVDQDFPVRAAKRVSKDGDGEVWAKRLSDGSTAVGLFNLGEDPIPVRADWNVLGLKGTQRVRDLWRQKDLGVHKGAYQATVPRHGVVLLKITSR